MCLEFLLPLREWVLKSNHTEVLVCVFYASKAFCTVALAFFCIPSGLSTQYLHHLLLPLFYGLFLAFFYLLPFPNRNKLSPCDLFEKNLFPTLYCVFWREKCLVWCHIDFRNNLSFFFFFLRFLRFLGEWFKEKNCMLDWMVKTGLSESLSRVEWGEIFSFTENKKEKAEVTWKITERLVLC